MRSVNRERWIVPRVSDLASAAASARGKLELTMSEDDGHEDKLIHRIIDEAVKNVFTLHLDAPRAAADRRVLRVGPERRGRRLAARPRPCSSGSPRCPACRKQAEELVAKRLPDLTDRDAREAATASAAEFILEGLHVHNKLNKSAKDGASSYRR